MTQLTLSLKPQESRAVSHIASDFSCDDHIVARGISILENRVKRSRPLDSPKDVRDFCVLKLSPLEHEVFYCLYLNNQLEYIDSHEMFRGTLSQATVYPREVAKEALKRNAAAIIVAHNHPSGRLDPSRADIQMTKQLEQAMQLLDIRLVDHILVAGGKSLSLKEGGYF